MAESVSRAIMDFFGEVFRTFGFIGRPRRRADIREDLRLLAELDASPHLTEEAKEATTIWLNNQIVLQVAAYSEIDLRTVRRKVQWGAVFFATCFWAPLGWLTYHLVAIGDGWWATFPAVPGAVFAMSTVALLSAKETVAPSDEDDDSAPVQLVAAAS